MVRTKKSEKITRRGELKREGGEERKKKKNMNDPVAFQNY